VTTFDTAGRYLRDLRWVIESPSLVSTTGRPGVADPAWSEDAEIDPQELLRFLEARSSRKVGYYFENLVHFWLQAVHGAAIVEHGRQIVEAGVTRGEIDFIFRRADGSLNHWETAVKFYLKTQPQEPRGSHLIGPDPSDNFALKHQRLFERQLMLSKKLPLRIDCRQGFMKGRIFYHPGDNTPATATGLNPQHLRGIWLRRAEIKLLDRPAIRYRILEKPFWLSPETGDADSLAFAVLQPQLAAVFANAHRPVLLAAIEEQQRGWRECERVIIVPDDWPATGDAPRA